MGYVTGPLFLWVGEQGFMQYGGSQAASDPHWLGSEEWGMFLPCLPPSLLRAQFPPGSGLSRNSHPTVGKS